MLSMLSAAQSRVWCWPRAGLAQLSPLGRFGSSGTSQPQPAVPGPWKHLLNHVLSQARNCVHERGEQESGLRMNIKLIKYPNIEGEEPEAEVRVKPSRTLQEAGVQGVGGKPGRSSLGCVRALGTAGTGAPWAATAAEEPWDCCEKCCIKPCSRD